MIRDVFSIKRIRIQCETHSVSIQGKICSKCLYQRSIIMWHRQVRSKRKRRMVYKQGFTHITVLQGISDEYTKYLSILSKCAATNRDRGWIFIIANHHLDREHAETPIIVIECSRRLI